MNLIGMILIVLFSINIVANANEAARSMVQNELVTYQSEYGISNPLVGEYLGVINKKYSFKVQYNKNFCNSVACVKLLCATKVGLDSDAVIDFEAEQNPNRCK